MTSILTVAQTVSAQEADAKLERFFKQYLDEHFKLQPMQATELGDHRFDALLDDVSKPARDKWLAEKRGGLRGFHDRLAGSGGLPIALAERALFA